jgi:antitoxin component of MazEF toxin-antitoxin module
MKTAIRKMENSHGSIIPKPLLAEVGAKANDQVDMGVENGKIVIAPMPSFKADSATLRAFKIASGNACYRNQLALKRIMTFTPQSEQAGLQRAPLPSLKT